MHADTLTFVFAFVVVLALIGGAAWLVRRFAGNRLGTNANRGRMPRLAVIDAAAVDGRRRLVLVRRDNVEHLLMIGGPTDIVVEPNIVRATPGRDQMPQRPVVGSELPRLPPLPETGWTETDGHAIRDARSSRTCRCRSRRPAGRPSFADEVRRSPPPAAGAPQRSVGRLRAGTHEPHRAAPGPARRAAASRRCRRAAADRSADTGRRSPSREAAPVAVPPPLPQPAAPPPAGPSSADQNLAEMAQRLEAALRRPAGDGKPAAAPPVAPNRRVTRGAAESQPSPHRAASRRRRRRSPARSEIRLRTP